MKLLLNYNHERFLAFFKSWYFIIFFIRFMAIIKQHEIWGEEINFKNLNLCFPGAIKVN